MSTAPMSAKLKADYVELISAELDTFKAEELSDFEKIIRPILVVPAPPSSNSCRTTSNFDAGDSRPY